MPSRRSSAGARRRWAPRTPPRRPAAVPGPSSPAGRARRRGARRDRPDAAAAGHVPPGRYATKPGRRTLGRAPPTRGRGRTGGGDLVDQLAGRRVMGRDRGAAGQPLPVDEHLGTHRMVLPVEPGQPAVPDRVGSVDVARTRAMVGKSTQCPPPSASASAVTATSGQWDGTDLVGDDGQRVEPEAGEIASTCGHRSPLHPGRGVDVEITQPGVDVGPGSAQPQRGHQARACCENQ